ncbi:MAG: hypothetical protein Q8O31_08195 [Rhodocyclaceae bacterium]|nr:hypothetical protein [Rhodocyclaceae bacterium]
MRLAPALAISLALHGVLLRSSPSSQEQVISAAPLVATLRVPVPRPTLPAAAMVNGTRGVTRTNDTPVASPVVAAPTPVVPIMPEEGLDADGMRLFRVSLARQASRFKPYPFVEKGSADIRLIFRTAGVTTGITTAEVARSSGVGSLDEAALDMLRQAASVTVIPESLRGRDFAVNFPVVFE